MHPVLAFVGALLAAVPSLDRASLTVTSEAGFHKPGPEVRFGAVQARKANIAIDPAKRFQTILGFGAAITDASAYVIDRMPADARSAFIEQTFAPHPKGMGFNVCRVAVGASDYARTPYSYDDGPEDPTLARFSIDHDRAYILPVLAAARQANPEMFLFSAPWSPPGWMKTGGELTGGWMRPKYTETFARYYARFLTEYAQAGVRIDALTPQNEPETDQQGRMPAAYWHPDDEVAFVKALAPLLKNAGLTTKIWIHDHNYDLVRRPMGELRDSAFRGLVDGVAFHPYGGKPEAMAELHAAYPEKTIHYTEHGSDLGPNYGKDWVTWGEEITAALRNWAASFTAWNLALDEKGTPNIGPFHCAGTVTIDSTSHALTYDGQYWALGHFSRFVRRGAVRVDSSGQIDKVGHIAFVNPDGGIVVVITNSGPKREITLSVQQRSTTLELPANSIVTLTTATGAKT